MGSRVYGFWLMSGLFIVLLEHWTELDLTVSGWFYLQSEARFWGQGSSLANSWYQTSKMLMVLLALFVLGKALMGLFRPGNLSTLRRQQWAFVAIMAVVQPCIIWLIRAQSQSACPRSIIEFGGESLHLRLLDATPALSQYGHCNPSAHASAFLWVAAFAVFYLPNKRRIAWGFYWGASLLALLAASVQVVKGAHFLSHLLLSWWVSAGCLLLSLLVWPPPRTFVNHHSEQRKG